MLYEQASTEALCNCAYTFEWELLAVAVMTLTQRTTAALS